MAGRRQAHLEFAFKFFPKGYKPTYRRSTLRLGNGIDIDVRPNQANQELHAYAVLQEHTKIITFEPHMHAPGVRMCLEAIWGHNIQTLNCVGYDHNWVKQYVYDDDAAPLLPKGTIVHLIGFLDTTAANKNPADPRNWAGGGRRSIANMFIDLGYAVSLTEDQFQAEMAKRRENMKNRNDYDIGCPLCWAPPVQQTQPTTAGTESSNAAPRDSSPDGATVARPSDRVPVVHCASAQTRFTYSSGQSCVAGLRRMAAERGRIVHDVVRLHELELAAGVRHSDRPRQRHRAGRPRSGAADAFLSAPQSVPVHDSRARRNSATKELIWTLTANGKTEHAYASLKSDYQIDNQVISTEVGGDFGSLRDELRTNIPPELEVEGDTTGA